MIVAFAATLAAPTAAHATPYPETWLPDNRTHAFCFSSSFNTTAERDVAYWAMDRLGEPTDMISKVEACASGTDLYWYAVNLGPGLRGEAQCMRSLDNGRCDTADIRMDFAELNSGGDDWYDQRKTAVHEIGHTVGLGHHSPSAHACAMVSGEVPSRDMKWRTFHSHDIAHINATF